MTRRSGRGLFLGTAMASLATLVVLASPTGAQDVPKANTYRPGLHTGPCLFQNHVVDAEGAPTSSLQVVTFFNRIDNAGHGHEEVLPPDCTPVELQEGTWEVTVNTVTGSGVMHNLFGTWTATDLKGDLTTKTFTIRIDTAGRDAVLIQPPCKTDGLKLFEAMMPVFSHARCINCHGATNPITGVNHGGGEIDNNGQYPFGHNEVCLTCHDEKAVKRDGKDTGPWRLAPPQFLYAGKTAAAICKQMSEFAVFVSFTNHVAQDELIGFGFEGLRGGAAKDNKALPPPMTRAEFVALARRWVDEGHAQCGCIE